LQYFRLERKIGETAGASMPKQQRQNPFSGCAISHEAKSKKGDNESLNQREKLNWEPLTGVVRLIPLTRSGRWKGLVHSRNDQGKGGASVGRGKPSFLKRSRAIHLGAAIHEGK